MLYLVIAISQRNALLPGITPSPKAYNYYAIKAQIVNSIALLQGTFIIVL